MIASSPAQHLSPFLILSTIIYSFIWDVEVVEQVVLLREVVKVMAAVPVAVAIA
jgi:hypothetical protein